MALQPDGKIVAVGSARDDNLPNADFLVMRFTPGGGLDNTWDSDGIAFTAIGAVNDVRRGVAIQPDGKIVVAGDGGVTTVSTSLGVARYNSDATLDTTFDGDGKLPRNFTYTETGYDVE